MFEVEFGHAFSRDGSAAGDEYGCTGASVIYNCQDGVKVVALRKLGD